MSVLFGVRIICPVWGVMFDVFSMVLQCPQLFYGLDQHPCHKKTRRYTHQTASCQNWRKLDVKPRAYLYIDNCVPRLIMYKMLWRGQQFVRRQWSTTSQTLSCVLIKWTLLTSPHIPDKGEDLKRCRYVGKSCSSLCIVVLLPRHGPLSSHHNADRRYEYGIKHYK